VDRPPDHRLRPPRLLVIRTNDERVAIVSEFDIETGTSCDWLTLEAEKSEFSVSRWSDHRMTETISLGVNGAHYLIAGDARTSDLVIKASGVIYRIPTAKLRTKPRARR
jgi:hypothetical protein